MKRQDAKHRASNAELRIADSARRRELVVIVGTGVSVGLTEGKVASVSWKGLIESGFDYGAQKGRITSAQKKAWKAQLDSTDLDDLLGAAEFVCRKLDAPNGDLFARWLEGTFKHAMPTNSALTRAILAVRNAGIPICTLNYDHLLEQVTGLPAVHLGETAKVTAWMRREVPAILHLHGSWDVPTSCVLGIRDYETTIGNDVRDLIQRSLVSFSRLLFVGCGDTFADPNFVALIKWLREKIKTAAPQHYALVTKGEYRARNADPTWHGFVEPLNYGAHHDDLADFLLNLLSAATSESSKSAVPTTPGYPHKGDHSRVLRDYRAFLVRDCGQMTIEGVRADMDTAQRRFDLERLFVPLKVLPCPPDIPESDPNREQKLLKWQEKNSKPVSFGKAFAKHKRLALLALPGGGKTILLKRLAVAYADPARRRSSDDELSELDITPVLIRCREWREHIHRPIATLLRDIPTITGQTSLSDIDAALMPLFETGRALLLVDGLDEIHDDGLRSTLVENLEAFLDQYKTTRLLVTSREAGFGLVAPCLARFCERWRIAPLQPEAISSLCDHWHLLMKGDTPDSRLEGQKVAEHLVTNPALLRLAENPLLLTMLLVVKQGAGRLPPDRVSLYSRAAEILLDTWNIRGHAPLSPKEAVPQLACLAFHLLKSGKQTGTAQELLTLLEQAREKVPQIRRYAKDTPHEFLKRVELRSSLLVEAGHQRDGTSTVPFYQFRHLTFQEHLAAVAAVEGHYMEYEKGDTLLTPLKPFLAAEEWKEVIPMAAVLARKQAEPLVAALAAEGEKLRNQFLFERNSRERPDLLREDPRVLPTPIRHLAQCLLEEAEASPETLVSSLRLVAFFARGCESNLDWETLCSGPYGSELLHQAWLLYAPLDWPESNLLHVTCARIAASRKPRSYWQTPPGRAALEGLLDSQEEANLAAGLFTCAGLCSGHEQQVSEFSDLFAASMEAVEKSLRHSTAAIRLAAEYAWCHIRYKVKLTLPPRVEVLDLLLELWLSDSHELIHRWAAIALWTQLALPRNLWTPVLSAAQKSQLLVRSDRDQPDDARQHLDPTYDYIAAIVVAFHAHDVWSDEELAMRIEARGRRPEFAHMAGGAVPMLKELGPHGQRVLGAWRKRRLTTEAT